MTQFLAKKKKQHLVWIIFGTIVLVAIWVIIYFATKKDTKQKTSENSQSKTTQEFQQKVNQIEQVLNKPENLTKIRLKTNLSAIKEKLSKLSQESNLKPETIQQLVQEIKQIQQELDSPKEPDNPTPQPNPSPPFDNPRPKPSPQPDDNLSAFYSFTPEEKQEHIKKLKEEVEKTAQERGVEVLKVSNPQQISQITEQAKDKSQLSKKEIEDIWEKDNKASFSDYWAASLEKLKRSDLPEAYLDFSEEEQRLDLLQEYASQRDKITQLNKKIRPSLEIFPSISDTDSFVKWLNDHFRILIEAYSCISWQEQLAKYAKMPHIPLELKIYGLFTGKNDDWYTNPSLNWVFYYHQFEENLDKAIDYRKN